MLVGSRCPYQIPVSGWSRAAAYGTYGLMRRPAAIRTIMFALALLGLLLGPMAVSMSGAAMADQTMSGMTVMGNMAETATMPDDMPCCPEKQAKVPDCSKGCPLNVLCLSAIGSVSSAHLNSFSFPLQKDLFHPVAMEVLASWAGDPPHRPPTI
jgi:hypothetical protein